MANSPLEGQGQNSGDNSTTALKQAKKGDSMKPSVTYYVPYQKWELVAWFKKNKPGWKVSGWNKSKLFAVYHRVRGNIKNYSGNP